MEKQKERIHWIDLQKGICMIAILLFHTEFYYNDGTEIINYNLYVCNALVIFFFLSGYHFYQPDINDSKSRKRIFTKKIKGIARGIVLPYFIFTSIIALPKAIAHNTGTEFTSIALKIISGNASWFVAALGVAELLFSTLLYTCKWKNSVLFPSAVLMLALSLLLSTTEIIFWWQTDIACMAFFYLYLGFLYHQKEEVLNRFNSIYYTFSLFFILLILKIYIIHHDISLIISPIKVSNIPIFLADSIVSILLMTNIAKLLPRNRIIEWTGAHSLVYYFFCGGVPFTISTIFRKIGFPYNGEYYKVIFAFLIVYSITSLIAWTVYRYLPFMVGKRKNN